MGPRSAIGLLSSVALLCACTPDARPLTWIVEFEDPSLESRAVLFEGVITTGNCTERRDGPALYREEFRASESPEGPGALAPGTYSFSVNARGPACEYFARGCTSETLPEDVDHQTLVVLFAVPEEVVCPMQCSAGACITPDATLPDTGAMDTGIADSALDTSIDDSGQPDTAPTDTAPRDTFVPECTSDADCGTTVTYSRISSWSCRTDGALDRADFEFRTPECTGGRCGFRTEIQRLECRCRDDRCSSAGCEDVVDSSTRCDVGGVEGECPNPAVERECHR